MKLRCGPVIWPGCHRAPCQTSGWKRETFLRCLRSRSWCYKELILSIRAKGFPTASSVRRPAFIGCSGSGHDHQETGAHLHRHRGGDAEVRFTGLRSFGRPRRPGDSTRPASRCAGGLENVNKVERAVACCNNAHGHPGVSAPRSASASEQGNGRFE